ncbi:hypothetical protein PHLGIDRAFT_30473 [Phlebiopsis gigantea 11061_1 CR5-6]|uniref:Zn(2)-C6 fungal-type domain-containing protein n=1 Tax=Phlebiopsis gigantea (strain 11061_1 CR5-6) TaxID=745531 RepID=A0A0C3RXC6_PHLG1|nr:hypothetical protein PHLGIDRAFT_30473 [Phlebiopsis gigantea 11061_1 CR5-6]
MATEGTKSPAEQPAHPPPPPAMAPYPPPYGAHYATMPPGAYAPPLYAFAPVSADPNHDPNAPNGAHPPQQYLMAFPPHPGMMYAYAPPNQDAIAVLSYPHPGYAPPPAVPSVVQRPKRKQVKMACTNCAAACKRCDDNRPCERCTKYGLTDTCIDGQRKERKKGVKRGPYKRKPKAANNDSTYQAAPSPSSPSGEGETSSTPAPYVAAPPPLPHEAYYPSPYYYPHPAYAPPPQPGHEHGEGAANGAAHPVPQPYFPLHPAMYPPPYPQYAPPVAYAAPPTVISPPPADASKSPVPTHENGADASVSSNKGKKKARPAKGAGEASVAKSKKTPVDATNGTNGAEAGDVAATTNGYPAGTSQAAYELAAGGSETNGTNHGPVVSPV